MKGSVALHVQKFGRSKNHGSRREHVFQLHQTRLIPITTHQNASKCPCIAMTHTEWLDVRILDRKLLYPTEHMPCTISPDVI